MHCLQLSTVNLMNSARSASNLNVGQFRVKPRHVSLTLLILCALAMQDAGFVPALLPYGVFHSPSRTHVIAGTMIAYLIVHKHQKSGAC